MDFDNNKQMPLLDESKNHEEPRMRMNNFLGITKVRHNNNTGKLLGVHATTRPGRKSTLLKLTNNVRTIFAKKTRRGRRNRRVSTRRNRRASTRRH